MDRRTFNTAMGLGLILGSAAIPAQGANLYRAAKMEGGLTWYVAHYGTRVAEIVAARFEDLYPGIKVSVVRATSQAIFQRLTQDIRSNSANCDVFSSSDPSHYLTLKKQGVLLPYKSTSLQSCLPEVIAASDPEHTFTITDVYMTSLVRTTKTVQADEAPKKWPDILHPKWKNQIALAHPGFSGDAGAWVVAMNRLYGWSFFEKLAENKPFVSRSIAEVPTTLGNGERQIGIAPPNYVLALASRGLPVAPVYPEDGVGTGFAPSAIMASTTRPNTSKLFLEYLSSKEAGEALVPEFRLPIRSDVVPEEGVPTLGSVASYLNDPQEIGAELPKLVERWRDLFGV